MLRTCGRLLAGMLLFFTWQHPCRAASREERFEEFLAEARSYDPNYSLGSPKVNRDRAVETYLKAVECSPDDPRCLEIEWRAANLLAYIIDPKNRQGPRRDDANAIFKGIVERYPKTCIYTIRSSILCGDLHMIKGDTQTAQTYYRNAIEGLAEKYSERKERSRNPQADDFDLFNSRDRRLFLVALRQYTNTVGPRGSSERLVFYDALAREFPGTPFERIAMKNGDKIRENMQASLVRMTLPEVDVPALVPKITPQPEEDKRAASMTEEPMDAEPANEPSPVENEAPPGHTPATWIPLVALAVLVLFLVAAAARRTGGAKK